MADLPTPRSYSGIISSMLNTFLSRLGLPEIKTGDPSLSLMEAAAQSDFRSTQDIFQNLQAQSLSGATGLALDRKGRDERVSRIGRSTATGKVTFGDSSFSKVETRIYQGGSGATAGSTVISIENSIPSNGNLYIGRGTGNAEGPIAYTTVAPSGSHYLVTLTTPTQNYHQSGEGVIYAQGGDRLIPAGTIVSTPATSAGAVISYRTLFAATLLDGEVTLGGIDVEAVTPGASSNIGAGILTTLNSPPYSGATVTNPLTIDNGTDTEDEDTYRERIRLAKKTRAKAIKDAIVNGLVGARASDESGSILSVSTSFRNGEPRTLYIDDGTGYQEKDEGVVAESLIDSAVGGEQYFTLSNRPVAKAYLKTRNAAPFTVVDGSTLTLSVGGVPGSYTFSTADFRDLNNASAYEIATAINSEGSLPFSARVCDSGLKVAFYAKAESQEDIEWIGQTSAIDANDWLLLPLERVYTLYLYKNDVLLSEDGRLATVTSKLQNDWGSVSSGATLTITVDGVPVSVTVTDSDFINAETGNTSVSILNPLESWAAVLNYKIPGVTASVIGGSLELTSNLNRNNRASVSVTGGTLGSALFAIPSLSAGLVSDYSLDRNSGNIKLSSPLVAGDRLVAGSASTNGFLSAEIGTKSLTAAELWFTVDGNPSFPVTNIGTGTTISFADYGTSPAYGKRVVVSGPANTWNETIEGDWLIITDSAVNAGNRGAFRVSQKISGTEIHIERSTFTAQSVGLTNGGVYVVRSSQPPQKVVLSTSTVHTPTSLAAELNAALPSVTATAVSTALRLSTNNSEGDIALVAANPAGLSVGFPFKKIAVSGLSHKSYLQSGNSEFEESVYVDSVTAVTSPTVYTGPSIGLQAKFLRPLPDSTSTYRMRRGNEKAVRTLSSLGPNTVRTPALSNWLIGDRVAYGFGFDISPRDNIQLMLDGDTVSGRYNIDLYRKCKLTSTSGGWTLTETNGDSLAKAFGTAFNWQDYALAMKPRVKTHSPANVDTTKTVLYRWWRHDSAGGRVQYQYPLTASAGVNVETQLVDSNPSSPLAVVRLASGAARTTPEIRSTSKIGMAIGTLSGVYPYRFVANLAVSNASRTIRIAYSGKAGGPFTAGASVTGTGGGSATVVSDSNAGATGSGYLTINTITGTFYPNETLTKGGTTATSTSSIYGHTVLTLTLPSPVTDHGLQIGDVIYSTVNTGGFTSGARQIDARSTTTIEFVDPTATIAAVAGPGTVSFDSSAVSLTGSTVVTGDIYSNNGLSFKVTASGTESWTADHQTGATNTILTWGSPGTFFPLNSAANTSATIATAVNALSNCSISAVGVGSGGVSTGVVDAATYETSESGSGATSFAWTMIGGTDYVQSTNTPGSPTADFVFTTRSGVPAALAANADIAGEDVRLVPRTAKRLAGWLNSTATGGLANRGGAFVTDTGVIQVHSATQGGTSSVAVSGGSGNDTGVAVMGSTTTISSSVFSVKVPTASGLSVSAIKGGVGPVWAKNATLNEKTVFTSATKLTGISLDGTVELDATTTKAWTSRNGLDSNVPVMIEKLGDIAVIQGVSASLGGTALSSSGVVLGDWIYLQDDSSPGVSGTTVTDPSNLGFFRVIEVDSGNGRVLIDNPNAVAQLATTKIDFIAYHSVIPGDTVSFGSTVWGASNTGSRVVKSLGDTEYKFVLDTTVNALTANGAVATPLGSNATLFRVEDGVLGKTLFEIRSVIPDGADTILVCGQSTSSFRDFINESYGTTISSVGKLQFPTVGSTGRDSYKKNTGLIAEANKIVFGDETAAGDYQGIASAGASYNIAGPLVKRIQIALAIRPITGIAVDSIRTSIQSSVAAAINKTLVGQSVSISEVVKAAQSVNGVQAVSVSSPAYNVGNDLIPVQAYEKALVLDIENDITVSFIGE